MTVTDLRAERLRRIAASCAADGPDLFAHLSAKVGSVVPFDAAAWFATDPATLLPTLPLSLENLDPAFCEAYWTGEFEELDVMLFRDLARSPLGADSLLHATGGMPSRSHRYRAFLHPQGFHDEVRATFRLGSGTWGVVDLCRSPGLGPFTPDEVAMLAAIGPGIAAALSTFLARPSGPDAGPTDSPGTALYGLDGALLSADARAECWFRELAGPGWDAPTPPPAMVAVGSVIARANAVARGRERGESSSRVRAANGRWIALHASPTWTVRGTSGPTVLVLQAARSGQVAPIVEEAFHLTPREREITKAVARGRSNAEIARELCLSTHTVRDHLTAVFAKVGVAGRGELVARIFAEVHEPA